MPRSLSRFAKRSALSALLTLAACVPLHIAHAQMLRPKRTLTAGAAPGCELAPAARDDNAPRNNAEARRLAAAAQEAALQGDQVAARAAYVRAAQLNPADERLTYDLARAHEELADTLPAIGAYCRYLALAPNGTEASDVRNRLRTLVPNDARQRAEEAGIAFQLGLGFMDARNYNAAVRAFDEVVRLSPAAPEGHFNRGLARSAVGARAGALSDLETYRAGASTVEERVETARAIDVLRRPVYSPTTAMIRGALPGFGQFYTARPVRGVVVLAAVAGSLGAALMQQTNETVVNYVDPNGFPAPYTEITTERKYFGPGVAAAVGITAIAAIEAVWYANRSRRGASIIDRTGGVSVSPTMSRDGAFGLAVRAPMF